MSEAFLQESQGKFVPTAHARGPWAEDSLHGRILAGLFARAFERSHGDADFHFSRLTVDMFRFPRLAPLEVETDVVREGRRIRVLQGSIRSGGVELARASAVLLRRGQAPPGRVWKPDDWDAPAPESLPPRPPREGGWTPMWDTRPISAEPFGGSDQRARIWLREIRELVEGERLSAFARVALAADIASPLANSGDQSLHYVNADITLYLHRLPRGEWTGWEVTSHQSEDGIAVGDCTVYDEEGAIGRSTVCALANRGVGEPRSGNDGRSG